MLTEFYTLIAGQDRCLTEVWNITSIKNVFTFFVEFSFKTILEKPTAKQASQIHTSCCSWIGAILYERCGLLKGNMLLILLLLFLVNLRQMLPHYFQFFCNYVYKAVLNSGTHNSINQRSKHFFIGLSFKKILEKPTAKPSS